MSEVIGAILRGGDLRSKYNPNPLTDTKSEYPSEERKANTCLLSSYLLFGVVEGGDFLEVDYDL